jgi:hypothetical protein
MKVTRQIVFFAAMLALLATVQCSKRDDSIRRLVVSPENVFFNHDSVLTLYITVQPPGPFSWAIADLPKWVNAEANSGSSDGEIVKLKLFNNPLIFGGGSTNVKVVSNIAGESTFSIGRHGTTTSTLIIEQDSIHFNKEDDIKELNIRRLDNQGVWQLYIDDDWLVSSIDPGTQIYTNLIFLSIDRTKIKPNQTTTYIRFVHKYQQDTVSLKITAEYVPIPVFGATVSDPIFEFTDQSKTLWVKNNGELPGSWRLGFDETLFSANPSSGSLGPNDSILVNLGLIRDNLPDGIFQTEVNLLNNSYSQLAVKLEFEIRNYNGQIHTMLSKLAHTTFDKINNQVLAVTSLPNQLLAINPDDWSINSVQLGFRPNCVAVTSNSNTAFVGHNGKISQIDLQRSQVEHVFQSSANVREIFAKNNDWVYYTSSIYISSLYALNTQSLMINTSNQTLNYVMWSFLAEHLGVLCISESQKDKYFDIENGEPVFIGEKERGTHLAPKQISNNNNHLILANGSYNVIREGNLMNLQEIGKLSELFDFRINFIGFNEQTNHGILNPQYSSGPNNELHAYDLNTFTLAGQKMLPDFLLPNVNGESTFYPSLIAGIFVNSIENKVILIVAPQGYSSDAWGIIQFEQEELLQFNHLNLKRK